MRLGIYGGTFNPPHTGHVAAAAAAVTQLELDRLLIVPAGLPPHKELPSGTPAAADRLELVRLSFSGVKNAEILDIELKAPDVSYTAGTVDFIRALYPEAGLWLIMGSDMYMTIETWRDALRLLRAVTPVVLSRGTQEDIKIRDYSEVVLKRLNAPAVLLRHDTVAISSTQLRQALPRRGGGEFIDGTAYEYIIKNRLYGARPDFDWLRDKAYGMMTPGRAAHTKGCEEEAARLARFWNAPEDDAREAAILHDITKKLDLAGQLQLCEKYDIMTDILERSEPKLLHAKTGAAVAREQFGAPPQVSGAIMWHTTGREDMTLLEKILYIADYIEPTRDFEGVDALRRLAYSDLDKAVIKGLEMSIDDLTERGITPHPMTNKALIWLRTGREQI